MSEEGAGDGRTRVAICICTHRRPAVLDELLHHLGRLAQEAADRAEVRCVVVDDDPEGSAQQVVDSHRDTFEAGVVYAVTGSGNISVARNRALAEGTAVADVVALTDDDCTPWPGWLRELLGAMDRHDAEMVSGHVIDLPPPGAPGWFVEEPWIRPATPPPDGAPRDTGPIKNTAIRSETVRRLDLHFDEAFGQLGGEDALFFYAAAHHGVRHRFAAAAVVEEPLPASRTTLGYQLRRALWYGNSEATTSIAAGRVGRARLVVSSLKRLLAGPAHVAGQLRRRAPSEWRWGLALTVTGCGRLIGAFGVRLRHSAVNARAMPRTEAFS